MMVYKNHILVYSDCTVLYFTNSDTTNIFIVVNRADQHLGRSFRITFRSRNVVKDSLEQWFHILFFIREIKDSNTSLCRSVYKRTFKLVIRSTEVDKEFKHFINYVIRSCFRTVNLIDTYDNRKFQLESFSQNELCLRHSTFKCINNKYNTIYHLKNTFYFSTEVSMSRCVNDIDLNTIIMNGSILRKDCNSTLTLDIIRVHDTFFYFLILTEYTTLF